MPPLVLSQLRTHLYSDHVRSDLSRFSDKDRKSGRWLERWKRLSVDVVRQDPSEIGLAWLMVSNHSPSLQ